MVAIKLLHLSQTDDGAGAGKAAFRIHKSMLNMGYLSQMLVANKRTADPTVVGLNRGIISRSRVCEWMETKIGQRLATDQTVFFSSASCSQFNFANHPDVKRADIICLYWVNGGFISPESLSSINKPIIWRLSDIWPFSGGCHYPGSCTNFVSNCGNCHQLKASGINDYSRRLWQRKYNAWKDLDMTIVAPSQWMATLAKQSSLFKKSQIKIIPTGVDVSIFKPQSQRDIRSKLNIPNKNFVIAFGALDPENDIRKGYLEFREVLSYLASSHMASRISAIIFGRHQFKNEELPIDAHFVGQLKHDELAEIYNAADIMTITSLEDNLPNTAIEAISSGTPVCGFDIGGMPDIIRDGWNGILVPLQDCHSLARGIIQILENEKLKNRMASNSRLHAVEKFSLEKQAIKFSKLINQIFRNSG